MAFILLSVLILLIAIIFWMLKMVEHQEYISVLNGEKGKGTLTSLFLNFQIDTLIKIGFPIFYSSSKDVNNPKAQSIAKRIKIYLAIFYACLLIYCCLILAFVMAK